MRSTILSCLAAFFLGIGVGWFVFAARGDVPNDGVDSSPDPLASQTELSTRIEARAQESLVFAPEAEPTDSSASVEASSLSLHVAEEALTSDSEDIERLSARIASLEAELDNQMQLLEAVVGSAEEWPEDVDPRFLQDEVVKRVNSALNEIGLAGEVAMAECLEYPCLLVGETYEPLDRQAWRDLAFSDAMQEMYADATIVSIGGSRRTGEDGAYSFGVAVFNRLDREAHNRIRRRMSYRYEQLFPEQPTR